MGASLLGQIALGSNDAMAALMQRYGGLVTRVIADRVRPGLIEDAIQEVWIRVWRNAMRYDARVASPQTWLMAIARNAATDAYRREHARPRTVELTPHNDLSVEPGAGRDIPSLDRLKSPKMREVMQLVYERQIKMRVVAEHLDIPLGTVKSIVGRALQILRENVRQKEAA